VGVEGSPVVVRDISVVADRGINTNPFRYAGEYFDSHRGEYYLRARHFNPRLGRFTQSDPYWNVTNHIFCPGPEDDPNNAFRSHEHTYSSRGIDITEQIRMQQACQNAITSIFVAPGLTSVERVSEANRWRIGRLTPEEQERLGGAAGCVTGVALNLTPEPTPLTVIGGIASTIGGLAAIGSGFGLLLWFLQLFLFG